ncbi:MAG: hypothetical protein ABIQ44_11705, partial [Chloroflexia bacterium]
WSINNDIEANIGAGVRYVGEQNVNAVLAGSPNARQSAFTTGDLRAGLSFGRYRTNFFVRNVTDKRAYLALAPNQNPVTGLVPSIDAAVLEPRVIGLSLDVKF